MFKVQEVPGVQDAVPVNLHTTDCARDPNPLVIGNNVFGMVEIDLYCPCTFLVEVKSNPVIVLGDGDFRWFVQDGVKVARVMCLRPVQGEIVAVAHPEMDFTATVCICIVAPLQVHAAEQA